MKKIALLFTMICASQLYGMETGPYQYCANIISHAYSYLPSFFSQSPKQIEILRKDKNEFEQKLILNTQNTGHKKPLRKFEFSSYSELELFNLIFSMPLSVLYPPINFLRFCYYQKFLNINLQTFASDMQKVDSDFQSRHLLDECKKTEINGYSAVGAAILAPGVSVENKREFIKRLFDLGFKPTKKDIMLAELALYDVIPESEKEKMILFLQQEDLLPEIKRNIISCMIEQYRIAYWLLPE